MTIKISDELYSFSIDDALSQLIPMLVEHDIRSSRTEKDIADKISALTFTEDMMIRVEQPFLIYQLPDQKNPNEYYVLNGVTRLLALREMKQNPDFDDYNFANVTAMYLESGWSVDELKSLQNSANNFTKQTEEINIAKDAVAYWNKLYDQAIIDNPKLKGRKLTDYAANAATEATLKSSIMRGKSLTHLKQYRVILNDGVEKLIELCEKRVVTPRVAYGFLALYKKYVTACQKAPLESEEIKSQTYILDLKLAAASVATNTDDFENPTITLPDFESWFKANTPETKNSNESEQGEESEESIPEETVINIDELTSSLKSVIAFSSTYSPSSEEKLRSVKERITFVKNLSSLVLAGIDTIDSAIEVNPKLDSLIEALSQFAVEIPQPTTRTNKIDKLSKAVNGCNKSIEKIINASVAPIEGVEDVTEEANENATEVTETVTTDIEGFTVSA